MNLVKHKVIHKKLGIGIILEQDNNYITVEFSSDKAIFQYPKAFEGILIVEDEELQEVILQEIQKVKTSEERSRKDVERVRPVKKTITDDTVMNERIVLNRANKMDLNKIISPNTNFEESNVSNYSNQKVKRDNGSKIKQQLEQKGVKHLIHFTRIGNLQSILQNGLVPVSDQHRLKIESERNDEKRLDGQHDCTSCSVEFPNDYLFSAFRKHKYPDTDWVILKLDKDILFSTNNYAYYCYTNAAHVLPKTKNKIDLCTVDAFNYMYNNIVVAKDRSIERSIQNLNSSMPTDSQAEILIGGIIDKKYIASIIFEDHRHIESYKSTYGSDLLDTYYYEVAPYFFGFRNDLIL